jgi:hypothetical protein
MVWLRNIEIVVVLSFAHGRSTVIALREAANTARSVRLFVARFRDLDETFRLPCRRLP